MHELLDIYMRKHWDKNTIGKICIFFMSAKYCIFRPLNSHLLNL
jgi:hypothetical protein